MPSEWIQRARKGMARNGSIGAFGKATAKKIARAKKQGGLAEKRAVFAQNLKRIAQKRHKSRSATRRG